MRKKKNTRKKAIPFCAFLFSLILYSTLIHPYQRFLLFGFFFFPFPLFSKTVTPAHFPSQQARENISQSYLSCQASFFFFSAFFQLFFTPLNLFNRISSSLSYRCHRYPPPFENSSYFLSRLSTVHNHNITIEDM